MTPKDEFGRALTKGHVYSLPPTNDPVWVLADFAPDVHPAAPPGSVRVTFHATLTRTLVMMPDGRLPDVRLYLDDEEKAAFNAMQEAAAKGQGGVVEP